MNSVRFQSYDKIRYDVRDTNIETEINQIIIVEESRTRMTINHPSA